jgi:hypothetical protein
VGRIGVGADWLQSKGGRQRKTLQTWLSKLIDAMRGRIHGFAVSVAEVWAEQEHLLEGAGYAKWALRAGF